MQAVLPLGAAQAVRQGKEEETRRIEIISCNCQGRIKDWRRLSTLLKCIKEWKPSTEVIYLSELTFTAAMKGAHAGGRWISNNEFSIYSNALTRTAWIVVARVVRVVKEVKWLERVSKLVLRTSLQ